MNTDTDALLDTAVLVVVGMAVVFVALFILMVAAMMMVRSSQGNKNTKVAGETSPDTAASSGAGEAGKETIAAMAVALASAMGKPPTASSMELRGATSTTQAGAVSAWSAAGRDRFMEAIDKAGRRWQRRPE